MKGARKGLWGSDIWIKTWRIKRSQSYGAVGEDLGQNWQWNSSGKGPVFGKSCCIWGNRSTGAGWQSQKTQGLGVNTGAPMKNVRHRNLAGNCLDQQTPLHKALRQHLVHWPALRMRNVQNLPRNAWRNTPGVSGEAPPAPAIFPHKQKEARRLPRES